MNMNSKLKLTRVLKTRTFEIMYTYTTKTAVQVENVLSSMIKLDQKNLIRFNVDQFDDIGVGRWANVEL